MKNRLSIAATLAIGLAGAPAVGATLYGTNYGGADNLFSIDTGTGAATSVGNTANNGVGDLTSDTRAASAKIWGVDIIGDNQLLEINKATGLATVVANITNAAARIISLAYDEVSSVLYGNTSTSFGAANDALYTIDVGTGVATFVGAIGYNDVFALSFDTSGNLFGVSDTSKELISINSGTGVGTVIAATGLISIYDMAYDPDSKIMFASDAGPDNLYSVNTSTGVFTLVGNYSNVNAGNVAGLAFGAAAAVPVPATLPILLTGLGALVAFRRRQKV